MSADNIQEKMTEKQMKKREEIVKSMKKDMAGFKDRYGDRAKDVMYATATKMAMGEEKDTHTTKDGRTAKKGLYYYINQKKKRGEKANPAGHEDRPTAQDFKDAAKTAKEETQAEREFLVKFEKKGGGVSVKNYMGKSSLDVESKARVDAKRIGARVASVRLKEDLDEAASPKAVQASEKIAAYAKGLRAGHIDKKDFMKAASLLKAGKVKEAIAFARGLDSDPRDFVLHYIQQMGLVNEAIKPELEKHFPASGVRKHAPLYRNPALEKLAAEKRKQQKLQKEAKQVMVCKDCGDEFDNPTNKECPHDSHDADGHNWVMKTVKEDVELSEMTRQEIEAELKKVRDQIFQLGQMADGRNTHQAIDARRRAIKPYAKRREQLQAMLDAMKESVDESIGSTIGGALGQYAGSKLGMDGPGRAHGELAGRAIEYNVRKMIHKVFGKKKTNINKEEVEEIEEAEQLDELSPGTLGNYIKKATHSAKIAKQKADDAEKDRARDEYNKQKTKYWKRKEGILKAVDSLTKEEVEIEEAMSNDDKSSIALKALVAKKNLKQAGDKVKSVDFLKKMKDRVKAGEDLKKEDVELDEGKVKELTMDISDVASKMRKNKMLKPFADKFVTAAKKSLDIKKSLEDVLPDYVSGGEISKLYTEEIEIDEAIPKSTNYALVHSSSKKIIAKGNKAEMMKKMKELNTKEKNSHHLGMTNRGKVGDTFGEEVELDEGYEKVVLDYLKRKGFDSPDFYMGKLKVSKNELAGVKKALQRATNFDAKSLEVVAEETVEVSEGVIEDLQKIVSQKQANYVKFADGRKVKVDGFSASAMVQVYNKLNDQNKQKFADAINKSENMFMKMLDFAFSGGKK